MPVIAPPRRPLVLAVGGAYAVVAASTVPLTAPAALAVAVPAALVLALAARRPQREPAGEVEPGTGTGSPVAATGPPVVAAATDAASRRTARAWTAVVALLAAAEGVALARQPSLTTASADSPTLSLLLDPVTEPWPWRLVAWCCWLGAGWALVSR